MTYNVNLDTRLSNDPARMRNEPPRRSVLEEIGNSVTHGLGALLSVAALVLMLTHSKSSSQTIAACIYGSCLILMFSMSCLYHAWRSGSTVKRLWRRFDYSSIYLLIGGTFAPLLLSYVGGRTGLVLFIVQWCVIAVGISLIGVFGPGHLRKLHMALYILLGWSGLVFMPSMLQRSPQLFAFILGGGITYTLGIIPFARHRKGAHFLWHFFVLFGAIIQWFGIYLYLYCA